jgi:hypothetical protein
MAALRYCLVPLLLVALTGCASEQHFVRDSIWPFGNPNAPDNQSETAERALGHSPAVVPIAPQTGNIWPGPVAPMPTIADVEKNMNQPLGRGYVPSLPSPYPPGQQPAEQTPDVLGQDLINQQTTTPLYPPGYPHAR